MLTVAELISTSTESYSSQVWSGRQKQYSVLEQQRQYSLFYKSYAVTGKPLDATVNFDP